MDKKQIVAIILMPLLAIGILFGASALNPEAQAEFYEGVGKGYYGDIKVRVGVVEDKIHSIEIVEISDTPGFGDSAAQTVAGRIIEAQSTEVDIVSGATLSSRGTIEAVNNALENVEK
ncbi:FMN-binding protein [Serpentinicella alkaliphila]|uniref:FMN-binding protein n=1 Tax=Serpentinicella alkaliphila TaxID=1734049 RepID=A0A4R2TGV4_9FIRM|nr:FMN-binding protein [Serpentinicella alkaliphila]QUH25323.1 FMN-binding protein [Serpentinicella alkaliphila]TCQ02391.1 FMN-binding protein [Serpentinicella alkaliphila]